jgi:predicted O-methyltransferase YrrM
MTFSATRWFARKGQEFQKIRGIVNFYSWARSKIRHGGLIFLPDEDILQKVMTDLHLSSMQSHHYYLQELLNNEEMRSQYEEMSLKYDVKKYKNWKHRVTAFPGNVAIYYALIRELKPKIIVETGTATGSMTSYLLAALNKNNHGRLISLDLPPVSGRLTMNLSLPQNEVGYWIPESYRDRWTYILGDSKITLPKVMAEEQVDFFIHDSLHTRSHMLFEYSVARALMRDGSIIASDDVLWNNSFDDFLMMNRLSGWCPNSNPNLGVAINKFDKFETEVGTGISYGAAHR